MPRTFNGSDVDRGYGKLERINQADPNNGLSLRSGKEHFGWYLVDGKQVFYASSKKSPRSVGKGRARQLAKYLRLTLDEFGELCDCTLTGPAYHNRIVEQIANGIL